MNLGPVLRDQEHLLAIVRSPDCPLSVRRAAAVGLALLGVEATGLALQLALSSDAMDQRSGVLMSILIGDGVLDAAVRLTLVAARRSAA